MAFLGVPLHWGCTPLHQGQPHCASRLYMGHYVFMYFTSSFLRSPATLKLCASNNQNAAGLRSVALAAARTDYAEHLSDMSYVIVTSNQYKVYI